MFWRRILKANGHRPAIWAQLLQLGKDPRVAVAGAQLLYLYFGIQSSFDVTWLKVGIAVAAAVALDAALAYLLRRQLLFPLSALPTALGIGMYFRAAAPGYFALAAVIAVASKYLIRRPGGGHLFNPSNFGIILTVLLFPSLTTIEFSQWGNSYWIYIAVAVISFAISYYAGVVSVSISFLAGYLFFLLALLPYAPDTFAPDHYGLLGPSVIVFATLMITDPKTIARGLRNRIIQGFSVAAFFFLFEYIGIRYALFLAIPFVTLLNFGSLYAFSYTKRLRLLSWAECSGTLAVTLVFAALLFGPLALRSPAQFSRLSISPDFILRGVESNRLVSPSDTPAFTASTAALGTDTFTYGGAWGDYNGDGYDDLFVSNLGGDTSRLYRNNGDGTFTDVTAQTGLPSLYATSAYFTDYDNNGTLDLFALYATSTPRTQPPLRHFMDGVSAPVRVFKNQSGHFKDVTAETGLGGLTLTQSDGAGMSFADLNQDGKLDFVLAVSGKLSPLPGSVESTSLLKSFADPRFTHHERIICGPSDTGAFLASHDYFGEAPAVRQTITGYLERGACLVVYESLNIFANADYIPWLSYGPLYVHLLTPGSVHLFENRGGRFVEHAAFSEQVRRAQSRNTDTVMTDGVGGYDFFSTRYFQPLLFDYNRDDKADIALTIDFGSPRLFKNIGNFSFVDVTADSHLDRAGTTMGISVSDFKKDGTIGMLMSNVLGDFLFSGTAEHTFSLADGGLSTLGFGWSASFLDYNLDGWDDLYIVNGDPTRMAGAPDPTLARDLFRADKLYRNDGAGHFNEDWGAIPSDTLSGKSMAISDYDNNGTPDIFVGNIALKNSAEPQRNVLYINQESGKHFLKVSLRGYRDNFYGVGAKVSVVSASSTQTKIVTIGGNFYSQNSLRLLFGLGDSDSPVEVRVRWPSGAETVRKHVSVDREILVSE